MNHMENTNWMRSHHWLRMLVMLLACVISSLNLLAINLEHVKYLMGNGDYEKALAEIKKLDISQSNDEKEVSEYNFFLGGILYQLSMFEDAVSPLQKGILYSETLLPENDCTLIENLHAIGSCYAKMDNYKEAEKWFEKAVLSSDQIKFYCTETSSVYLDLAKTYSKLGKTELSDASLKKGEEVLNRMYEGFINKDISSITLINCEYEFIEWYVIQGNLTKAKNTYENVLSLIKNNEGENSGGYISLSFSYATFCMEHYDGTDLSLINNAMERLKEIISIKQKYNINIDELYATYTYYLFCLVVTGRTNEIEDVYNEAYKYYSSLDFMNGVEFLNLGMGRYYFMIQDYSKAIEFFSKSLFSEKLVIGNENVDAIVMMLKALYTTKDKRTFDFIKWTIESMKEGAIPEDDKYVLYFRYVFYAYRETGDYDKAVESGEYALRLCELRQDSESMIYCLEELAQLCNPVDTARAAKYFKKGNELIEKVSERSAINFLNTESALNILNGNITIAINTLKTILLKYPIKAGNHNIYYSVYHNLGRAYMLEGKTDKAIDYLEQSVTLQKELNGNVMDRTTKYLEECYSKIK